MTGGTRSRVAPVSFASLATPSGGVLSWRRRFQFGITAVPPCPIHVRTNAGKATMSVSTSLADAIRGASAMCCARIRPWERSIALGRPVLAAGEGNQGWFRRFKRFAMRKETGVSRIRRQSQRNAPGLRQQDARAGPIFQFASRATGCAALAACRNPASPIAGSGKTATAPSRQSARKARIKTDARECANENPVALADTLCGKSRRQAPTTSFQGRRS